MVFYHTDPGQETFIHDSNHEKILLERHAHAREMILAVIAGDERKVMEHLCPAMDSIYEVDRLYGSSENSCQQMRNRLVSLNTCFSICADYAGVHPLYLHSLSRRFDREIEQMTTHIQEAALLKEMAASYCKSVRHALVEHFGDFSDAVIQIILSELSAPPCLEELAKQMGVVPATVSRRFKAETGMTIPEFTNRSRIRLAKLYMHENAATLSEIAHSIGFSDASYFSKIFLRYTGITPTEYLKTMHSNLVSATPAEKA